MSVVHDCAVIRGIVTQGWLWYCVLLITLYLHANPLLMPVGSPVVTACDTAVVVLSSQRASVPDPQVNCRTRITAVAGPVAAYRPSSLLPWADTLKTRLRSYQRWLLAQQPKLSLRSYIRSAMSTSRPVHALHIEACLGTVRLVTHFIDG